MNGLVEILSDLAKGPWGPTVFVGAVLLTVILMQFEQQNEKLDRIESRLDRIEIKQQQNSVDIAVLKERVRRYPLVDAQAQVEPAGPASASVATP